MFRTLNTERIGMARFSRVGLRLALTVLVSAPLASQVAAQDIAGNPGGPRPSTMSPLYRVNAGDELGIYVWGEERLQRDVKVLPDGTFAFPLVGQILAQGRLPQELEAAITERLREQYRGQVPQVTVSVKAATGLQFSVIGRVKTPGSFFPGRYINVLEALSMAGGPTEFAKLNKVVVLRKTGDQVQTIRARLAPLFKSDASAGDLTRSNVITLETGDTIIVP